jgi:cytochrome c-type biogenesis protein CcmF
VLLGIIVSSSNKEMISKNTSGIFMDFGKDSQQKPGENLTLVKGMRTDMGAYWLTYESDSMHPKKKLWYYNIHFQRKDGREDFYLQPNAFVNYKGNEGLMANPASRHYWDHDVFTYVTSLPDPDKQKEDTATFHTNHLGIGDTLFYSNGLMILDSVTAKTDLPVELFGPDGSLHEASVKVFSKTGSSYTIAPRLAIA